MEKIPDVINEEEFAARYSRLVVRLVRRFILRGGDHDDLFQEGMVGLLYAIRNYDHTRSDNFEAYASLCIKSRLVDAYRRSAAAGDEVADTPALCEYAANPSGDPEAIVLADESAQEIKRAISGLLSNLESSVLDFYLDGYTVKETVQLLGKSAKSVDNAILRIRNKLKGYLPERRQQE